MSSNILRHLSSVSVRNIVTFLVILVLVVVPLAFFYLADTRRNLVDVLSAKLGVVAQRGASLMRAEEIALITNPNYLFTPEHDRLVAVLGRIQTDFDVDNAVLYRRRPDGIFVYVADGNNAFPIGSEVGLHRLFPATREAAEEAWRTGMVGDTRLFDSGRSRFFQANLPVKLGGKVVAVLMLNDDATIVAQVITGRQNFIIGGVSAVMLGGTLVFWLISHFTLRPLLRLRRAALRISGGDLDVDIPLQSGRSEIAELNQAFRAMVEDLREKRAQIEEYNHTLERRIEERTREIRGLLDNMDEGIFRITAEGGIFPGASASTERMIGAPGDGRPYLARLGLEDAQQKVIRDTFALLLNPDLNVDWDDMVRMIPSEYNVDGDTWLKARYRPVAGEEGGVSDGVMVILQDITTEKSLQQDVSESQDRQAMIVNILQNQENFDLFYQDTLELLQQGTELAHSMDRVRRAAVDDLFRTMHTIKGTSGVFGMNKVAAYAHQVEETLRDLREKRDAEFSPEDRQALTEDLAKLGEMLTETDRSIRALTGRDEGEQHTYTLTEGKIDQVSAKVLAEVPQGSAPAVTEALARLKRIPTVRLLNKYRSLVERAAESLGKSVILDIDDPHETELSPDFFKRLDATFLHMIRNSVDHGVEDGERRIEAGKEPTAHIVLRSRYQEGGIAFTIADDGAGIDTRHILQAALERGFIKPAQAEKMTREDILKLLFIPGFSSAKEVTDLSGRGVGLDVVKTDVQRLGGRMRVTTRRGAGTTFDLFFPLAG